MGTTALVLLSGGMDSMVALWWALDATYDQYEALTFIYGSREEKVSTECARNIADRAGIEHRLLELAVLKKISKGHSALMADGPEVPDGLGSTGSVWVPGRNLVLLSVAGSYAEVMGGAVDVIVGFDEEEARTFPDNSKRFVENLNHTLADSVIEGEVKVVAPLIGLDKAGIAGLSFEMDVPVELSCSCYRPAGFSGGLPVHCGRCQSCILRRRGFALAGVRDPSCYEVELSGR